MHDVKLIGPFCHLKFKSFVNRSVKLACGKKNLATKNPKH